jgi:hypothetical protein
VQAEDEATMQQTSSWQWLAEQQACLVMSKAGLKALNFEAKTVESCCPNFHEHFTSLQHWKWFLFKNSFMVDILELRSSWLYCQSLSEIWDLSGGQGSARIITFNPRR